MSPALRPAFSAGLPATTTACGVTDWPEPPPWVKRGRSAAGILALAEDAERVLAVERIGTLGVRVLALRVRVLGVRGPGRRRPTAPRRSGIQAPVGDREVGVLLERGVIVSNRMPSHGRASAWPAEAWASIGRAMLIGIAKPMPWLSPATAVLMPMTSPLGSRSGPPLLPGLIAVSVWIRL